ncbi:efflux RND transporter periplasmic adaptor subunit [Klebsiella pneumoniae]|nr:efflux RND transporter periplasmic adaptor subunit [Klebsiella pneumoniae]
MSLQKTWGNIHLTALGAMMLSFLLVGCDDSVAQNAAPPAPTVSAAKVLVKSISQWDSFNGRIEAVESVQLRPRVSGYIDKVNYTDGQEVKKGQVLFTIDDRTYRAALEQAQADLNRRIPLGAANLIGREELQHARDTVASAQAELDVAIQQYNANQAIVLGTRLEQQPAVLQAATEVRNAWLALQRTQIVSPISGYVSRRSVQPGAQIGTTTPLMAVVPATNLWIDANFKETQLAHMRIGQPATVISDIYGDDVKYTGKVVGLDMGTGSAFSLLPAQNATGNWIKVVQRLPVRIELDEKQLAEHPLRIGLSTLVEVNTTDRDGEMLASQVRSSPVYESNAREIALDPVNKLIDEIIQANAG